MVTETRDLRGIPLWLVREYLVELGGAAQSEQHVIGPGWEVHLSQLADFQIGSLRIGEIRIEVTAQADIISELRARLDRKLIRAGG